MTKEILLDVAYTDESNKYWHDSYIKNKIFALDDDIHRVVARAMSEVDGVEMSYKGKPQGNIFVDDKNGTPRPVGYHYRVKTEMWDRAENIRGEKAYFTAWVTVKGIEDKFPIKEIA